LIDFILLAEPYMIDQLPPSLLRRYPIIDTDSRDEMRDALVHRYGAADFNLRRAEAPFRGVGNLLQLKSIALSFCSYTTDVTVAFPGDNLIRQQYVLSGSGKTVFGSSQFDISPNEPVLIPAEVELGSIFAKQFSMLTLRIDASALRSKLSALIGHPVGQKIEFSPGPTFRDPKQLQLRNYVQFMTDEVDREGATLPDVASAECEQLLMVLFLTSNKHNFSRLLESPAPQAAPWHVRVVEEYIRANWERPITIETLAEATGVGIRSMFKTFKDARGYSPMAFLRQVRLDQARRMLQSPDQTTSVTGVGLSCGFSSLGHFAHDYREAFNELPSVTLAMAKAGRRAGRSG
jgi:AraC-like DNA-binding protein